MVHRSGEYGIYNRLQYAELKSGILPIHGGAIYRSVCLSPGIHCMAAEISIVGLLTDNPILILLVLLSAAAVAYSMTHLFIQLIHKYFSFEARLRRHLGRDSILCTYQPIVDLRTGNVVSCEVLARYRDSDGTIVMPDQFLSIVERNNLTADFTQMVIGRAFRDLLTHLPPDHDLQVNFNIFPRDLGAAWLCQAFAVFDSAPSLRPAVEIVESDALRPAVARVEIEALRRAGIATYIDDFGTAYANIQMLAELPVEGVKLDRSFALAPNESLHACLLDHAIKMIHSIGLTVVVEGVETAERLALLKGTTVDRVQGYFIARPLEIAEFAEFLEQHAASSKPMREGPDSNRRVA
jgi:sensor c-di-GMP phosphodiesterase-like protein